MKIMYINNDGAGFADHVEVEAGATVAKLFSQRLPDRNPANYQIRVNGQHACEDQVLQANDRISLTPTKIEGADDDKQAALASEGIPTLY